MLTCVSGHLLLRHTPCSSFGCGVFHNPEFRIERKFRVFETGIEEETPLVNLPEKLLETVINSMAGM
jgi:hypothetical protein